MKMRILALLAAALCGGSAFADVIKTVQADSADQTVTVYIFVAADGTCPTGITFDEAGMALYYWRHGANAATAITEATQTVNGAHSDGGFVELTAATCEYRLDLPDAAVAAGATAVEVFGTLTSHIVKGGTVLLSPPANVVQWLGTAPATPTVAGVPEVDMTHASGVAGPVVAANGAIPMLGISASGTAAAYTAGTPSITLAASTAAADNDFNGHTIWVQGTEGEVMSACITDYAGATDIATISAAFNTAPTSPVYVIAPTLSCSNVAQTGDSYSYLGTNLGTAGAGATNINLPNQTMDITGSITGNLSGSVGSVTGAVGSVTGAVGSVTGAVGSVTGAVGSVAGDVNGLGATAEADVRTAVLAAQGIITGTCDSGSTTTCVDNALTQADGTQLADRLTCYDDGWCGMNTSFTPGTDTILHTKVAPSTRASKVYTIFPSTAL